MTQRRIYQVEYPYFVTFRTKDGLLLFEDEKMAGLLADIIHTAGRLKRYIILAYQIMPDHVHLIVQQYRTKYFKSDRILERMRSGNMEWSPSQPERTFSNVRSINPKQSFNISDLLQSIKGNFSRKIHQGNIWQKRFYARIVHTNKYFCTVLQYINYNPIKAELPVGFRKKPYQYFHWDNIKDYFK